MRIPQYSCDTCLKTAPAGADWWLVQMEHGAIPSLTMKPWIVKQADADKAGHACSKECALAVCGVFLEVAKIDKSVKPIRFNIHDAFFNRMFFGEPPKPSDDEDDD